MRKWEQIRIEEILVSNSSLVSGLSEASGVKLCWVEVSQKSLKYFEKSGKIDLLSKGSISRYGKRALLFFQKIQTFLGDFDPGELDSRSLGETCD